ncbi:TPA: hypothetical protein ACH3X1_012878 [Trebouxia sp. C0004]
MPLAGHSRGWYCASSHIYFFTPAESIGKRELEDSKLLEVKAIIARPPLLTSTTLQELGQNAKRQRTKDNIVAICTWICPRPEDSPYDNSENISKAITYGRMCLEQVPWSLRSTVLVGLTDLHTITLIRVTLPVHPDQEASMSVQVSEAYPDVRDTF